MIIGQATLGLEIMSQNSCADTVLLPTTINGCGLSLGIAIAIKGCNRAVKIIEIHSENTDTLFHRLTRHTTTTMELDIPEREYQTCKTNFRQSVFDEIIHVEESLVEQTHEYLHRAEGYRDYYAAIALAPILAEMMNDLKGRRVVVPIYGRMDSTKDLEERGLTARAGPLKTIWM
ncbi:PREDICTED: uncharacterized protein LOC105570217 [Vollenhovia emeryi]|uniref:uncharacterized protein LOC105570217 n=1 Tax=Vollenhovia emeryi TaxID=411798 RepID=UPI0005F41191|nr:PREDICTED: uncharacterized protein LOC105570217 [Vollenhovia emeryi]